MSFLATGSGFCLNDSLLSRLGRRCNHHPEKVWVMPRSPNLQCQCKHVKLKFGAGFGCSCCANECEHCAWVCTVYTCTNIPGPEGWRTNSSVVHKILQLSTDAPWEVAHGGSSARRLLLNASHDACSSARLVSASL